MTTLDWIIFTIGGAAAIALAWWTYQRREPAGRGRALLGALRAAALLLIILLLIDPQLGRGAGAGRGSTRVVLDASLSMMPRADTAAWQSAVRAAQQASSSDAVLTGDPPRVVARDMLQQEIPETNHSRVLPALQAAAEAGAQRVVLITDGAIEDEADVARWLPRLGIELDVRNVAQPLPPNRAIAELNAPQWAEAGQPLRMQVGIAARGMAGTHTVVVRQAGQVVAETQLELPAAGRVTTAELVFNAVGPSEGGLVRYDVSFAETDSIPDDDVRSAYVFVTERPAGVVIVSFLPDWEPRFLHPVMAQALGLPVLTFLRLPNGTYVRAGEGLAAGTRATEDAVRRAVSQAELVVLHGVSENAPAWWREVAARVPRLLVFPAGPISDPMTVGTGTDADWYVAPEVPASPVAGLLQNINVSELPPLHTLYATRPTELAWTPLHVGRTRRGGSAPLLLAQQLGNRRVAVATAAGYWRWAFRGDAARDVYTRLWGALAGWLVQDETQMAGAAIRPASRVIERGGRVEWVAPGLAADSFVADLDTDSARGLAPGHYRYVVRAFAEGAVIAEASGALTVESYSEEFMRAPSDLRNLRGAPTSLAQINRASGTPLHTLPWPYLVLVLLLCAEWILRRRWGLR